MTTWSAALRGLIVHLVEIGEALPMIEHVTPPCSVCGHESTLLVETTRLARWYGGEPIQLVFPDWTQEQRELLETGIHPACWNALFAEEER